MIKCLMLHGFHMNTVLSSVLLSHLVLEEVFGLFTLAKLATPHFGNTQKSCIQNLTSVKALNVSIIS